MDELVKQVIVGFPSFAGLLLMLVWQNARISALEARYDRLLEKYEECQERIGRQEETD